MVKIWFPLSFKIPIKDNSTIVSAYKYSDFKVSFNHEKRMFKSLDEDEKVEYKEEFTNVVVEYSNDTEVRQLDDINDIFHSAVVNSIHYVNRFIDALRSELNIRDINNFTITDLPSTIMIEYNNENYLYVTNPKGDTIDYIEVQKDEILRTLGLIKTWDKFPFIEVVDKFYAKAKHHLAKEDFLFAIIELQTSFEVFIRNTHKLILVKDNANSEEIEKANDIPFRNVIEQHLSKALKVNLKVNESGIIKNWYDNLYILRNQIVHSGKSFIEGYTAYNAYDSYIEARNYISKLLVNEGYLLADGKVDLSLFIKNVRIDTNEEANLHQRLIEKGLIPSDMPIIKKKFS